MIEVQDLRMVSAIAEQGTLTRAASTLHVTQSALSHRLTNLEERLSTRLFERRGRLLQPTPAGLRLRAEAVTLLSSLNKAVEATQAEGQERQAVLRIATECYTCYVWLPGVLREFRREAPRVEIEIVLEATRRPIPALLNGELDVAIVSSQVRDRRLRLTPFFRDELVAVVARDHPLASRMSIRAEAFATERLLAYTTERDENTVVQKVLIPAGVTPRAISAAPLTEALIEMAGAGLGIAVVARWAAAAAIERGTVSALRIGPNGLFASWHAACLRSAAELPHIRAFIRALSNGSGLPARILKPGRQETKMPEQRRRVPVSL